MFFVRQEVYCIKRSQAYIHRERQTDRQTDRDRERQRDRETEGDREKKKKTGKSVKGIVKACGAVTVS